MARTIGIGFAIGATLSSSVAKAFGAVGNSIEKTRAAMAAATKQQRVMSRAMELQSKRDALVSQLRANPGDAKLTRSLSQVSRQYREAIPARRARGAGRKGVPSVQGGHGFCERVRRDSQNSQGKP